MNKNEKLLNRYAKSYYAWMAEAAEDETINHCADRAKKLHEEVIALMEHKPVRWIDGAVRLPKVGDVITWRGRKNEKRPRRYFDIKITSREHAEEFYNSLWVLSSDFPIPEAPEQVKPVIELCPFCGVRCHVQKLPAMYVMQCDMCMYQTCGRETEQEVVILHNDLCRRLK